MSKNQNATLSTVPRRTFLKAAGVGAAVVTAPQLLLAKKTESQHAVVGENEHTYECIHN